MCLLVFMCVCGLCEWSDVCEKLCLVRVISLCALFFVVCVL